MPEKTSQCHSRIGIIIIINIIIFITIITITITLKQRYEQERTSLFTNSSFKDLFAWRHYSQINYSITQMTMIIITIISRI